MTAAPLLIIAGSDSSGGAGLQRDLQVLADHGCAAQTVVTAVTAQSPQGVDDIHHIPPTSIAAQLRAARDHGPARAIKIGMLGRGETVEAVADGLKRFFPAHTPVVLDPVLVSSSGSTLLSHDGLAAMHSRLLPLAMVTTPNIAELAVLLGEANPRRPTTGLDPHGQEGQEHLERLVRQAQRLARQTGKAVLLKGGHGGGTEAIDILARATDTLQLTGPRLQGSMRGTGCALSTAIAIHLGRGLDLGRACSEAKEYVAGLLQDQDR